MFSSVVAMVLLTTISWAADFSYILRPVGESTKLYFAYNQKPDHEAVKIRINDEKGFLLYESNWKVAQKAVVYDLKEFGEGNYVVEISVGDFKERKEINVGKKATTASLKVVFPLESVDGQVELVYVNNFSTVEISITDEAKNVIYSEVASLKDYRRKFNTSKLKAGKYTFTVRQGEKVFSEIYHIQ